MSEQARSALKIPDTNERFRHVSRQSNGNTKRAKARTRAQVAMMESFSIWHWVIMVMVIAMSASPVLGIVRGVRNGAAGHAIASVFLPVYGLVYFFAAKQPRN